jgi:cytochrome c-type biogenesis protein
MRQMSEVTYPISFLAGVVSFLSPCVLPLVPSYITFITGVSFEELQSQQDKRRVLYLTLTNALVFTCGFSAVFIALGASSSYIGQLLFEYQEVMRIAGGILLIVFGLFITGLFQLNFLMREWKFHMQGKPAGYIGTFIIGMTFAAGWTPCIGPILGSILVVASSKGSAVEGVKLLSVYSAGLAIPFLLSALAFNTFLSYSRKLTRYMRYIMMGGGILIIIFGILLLTNKVRELAGWLPDWGLNL